MALETTAKDELTIAEEIAAKAHKGQVDKSGVDYILHPKAVCGYCHSARAKITALLHDVVEDTPITLDDLLNAGIGADVVLAVDCLTKRENETLDAYLNRVASNDIAIEVKFADMRHNSDATRWPESMQQKAKENAQKYWSRMETLHTLIGTERLKKILSPQMYLHILSCIL